MIQMTMPFIERRRESKSAVIRFDRIPEEWRGDCTCYLLHFDTEIGRGARGRAQHYIGLVHGTGRSDLAKRLRCHRKGYANSSKLTRAFFMQGIAFHVGHVWVGVNAEFERLVKSLHSSREVCEVCQGLPFLQPIPLF